MNDKTPEDLLALPLSDNDSGADTVRGYLVALLTELWREEDGFSGKRPFGNSGWQYDIYAPMARAGFVQATFDSYGDLDDFSSATADAQILAAIRVLGEVSGA